MIFATDDLKHKNLLLLKSFLDFSSEEVTSETIPSFKKIQNVLGQLIIYSFRTELYLFLFFFFNG